MLDDIKIILLLVFSIICTQKEPQKSKLHLHTHQTKSIHTYKKKCTYIHTYREIFLPSTKQIIFLSPLWPDGTVHYSNRVLRLGSISTSITPTQQLQTEKFSGVAKGIQKFPFTPAIRVRTRRRNLLNQGSYQKEKKQVSGKLLKCCAILS